MSSQNLDQVSVCQRAHDSYTGDVLLLSELLAKFSIQRWDLLIVGDGSGNAWDLPSGWASILIDRATRGRRVDFGACSSGSINFAEALPYVQAINWYDSFFGKNRMRLTGDIGTLDVHIITDSQVVARWYEIAANQPQERLPRQHLFVWAAVREYVRLGYRFHPHWATRLTNEFNHLSDIIAGLARTSLRAAASRDGSLNLVERARAALAHIQVGEDVYSLHPNDTAAQ